MNMTRNKKNLANGNFVGQILSDQHQIDVRLIRVVSAAEHRVVSNPALTPSGAT